MTGTVPSLVGATLALAVDGPHRLYPLYALGEWLPATRAGARRLGLVTRGQLVTALVRAVEHPPAGVSLVDVPAIRGR